MDDDKLTDLATACQAGDRDSFGRLVESMTRTLIALAYRFVGDWETARDLTQDTWIKVYRSIEGYRPDRPFRSWLFTVHRNTCLSYLRKPSVGRERVMPPDELAALDQASDADDSQAQTERREFMQMLKTALEEISEKQRAVFTKIYIEQFSQREAAETLGMSYDTVRTTLHFARKRLAGILRRLEGTT